MNSRYTALASILSLGLLSPIASALDLPLLDDTYVDNYAAGSPAPAATNYGKAVMLRVYQSGTRIMRTVLKFDVSSASIPDGLVANQVAQATLRLWVNATSGAVGPFKIARLTSAFDENTLKNNLATFPTWDVATETLVPVANIVEGEFLDIDVTAWVKAWMTSSPSTPNYGMILIPTTSVTDLRFDSKEAVETAHEAKLDLVVVTAARVPARGDVSMGSFTQGPTP